MHICKSRFLTRGEVWYDHEPDPAPVDWIFYRQRSRPVRGAGWKYFYTRVLDLRQDPEVLLGRMSKTTAYHIRRARDKDRITCESLEPASAEILDQFEEANRRFAASKGLRPLDRVSLNGLATAGVLDLSVAKDPTGRSLGYHAYYRDSTRSCLLHAISFYEACTDSATRNALGRANRYHFWCDVLRHKEQGLQRFDFGGWYPGQSDRELLDINRFKEGFGGEVVREYNCEQILTLKGWIVLRTAALLEWAKRLAAGSRPGQRAHRQEPSGVDGERAPSRWEADADRGAATEPGFVS